MTTYSLPATPFTQRSPASRLVMGRGVIDTLASELSALGVRRPMVLAGARTRQSSLFAATVRGLGSLAWVDTAAIPPHSLASLVETLAVQARASGVDGFVSVGGGSAVDTAKAVAILLAEGGQVADHAVHFTPPSTLHAPVLRASKLPIVAIPGTASGAEVTGSVGVREASGAKLILSDPQVAARLVLLDAHAGRDVPAAVLCSTGMNALAHGIEGLYSRERTPMAETHALESLARLAQALRAVRHNEADEHARAQLLYGAHLAGLVLVNARTCLHHALCHVIGSMTGAAHGEANAVMLPHGVAFNAQAAAEPLARAARAVGVDGGAHGLVDFLRALQVELRVPSRLRDIGVSAAALPAIAQTALRERGMYYNPRPVASSGELLALLEAAY